MKISISKLNLLTISCAFVSVCLFICSTNRIIVQRTNAMLLAWTFSVTGYRNLGTVCTASVSICFVINPTDRHELHGTYTLFWNKHWSLTRTWAFTLDTGFAVTVVKWITHLSKKGCATFFVYQTSHLKMQMTNMNPQIIVYINILKSGLPFKKSEENMMQFIFLSRLVRFCGSRVRNIFLIKYNVRRIGQWLLLYVCCIKHK